MLNFFKEAGVNLDLVDGLLKVEGLKQLPPEQSDEIREKIKQHRTEIIQELSKKQPPTINDGRFIVTDDLEAHPVAGIVPEFVGVGYDKFKADIEAKGQIEPIILFQGKIIDGRARYRACKELGRSVIARQWEGGMDPVEYITAVNVLRSQEPPEIPASSPAGLGPEYERLWHRAWKLANEIDNPDGAPLAERRAKLPELMQMRDRMAEIERQAVPQTGPEREASPAGTWDTSPDTCPAKCKRSGKCYARAYFEGKPGKAKDCEPDGCRWRADR